MLKYRIILFFLLGSISVGCAQNHNFLLERLVSKKYIYCFDSSDSTFYRYNNNKSIIYNVPTKKKALFQISDSGFGFLQFKFMKVSNGEMIDKKVDSMYVSIDKIDDEYIIDYYVIKNKQKARKINYPVTRPDTAIPYTKVLMSGNYTVPYIRITDVLTKELIFQYKESKITWKEDNSTYYIDVDSINREHLNIIMNRLILDNIKNPKSSNHKNICKVDLKFMAFRTNKKQITSLLHNIKYDQIIHKEEKEKIDIIKCGFTDDLKKEIFVAQNFMPVLFSESNRLLISNRRIQNIFKINDSLIKYYVKNKKINENDTFSIRVKKLQQQKYILEYNQFANEKEFGLGFFSSIPKKDTIVNIKSAIKDSALCIDRIQINDNISDKMLLKIDNQKFKIIYCNQKVSFDNSFISRSEKIINDFILENLSKEIKNLPYEVMIEWEGNGVIFFCSKKTVDEFMNKIITQIK